MWGNVNDQTAQPNPPGSISLTNLLPQKHYEPTRLYFFHKPDGTDAQPNPLGYICDVLAKGPFETFFFQILQETAFYVNSLHVYKIHVMYCYSSGHTFGMVRDG